MRETKKLKIQSQKILINETNTNDIFMEWDVLLMKDKVNLNQYHFKSSFINSIVDNKDKYNGIPITVDLKKLLDKNFEDLSHNYSYVFDKFYTEQIGSYVDFYTENDEENILCLYGKARISKRNTDLIEILMEMYENDEINLSVEVTAKDWELNSNKELIIEASDGNYLFADCIVSNPAEPTSKVRKLVAQYLVKGNEDMKKNIFSELNFDDIRCQLSGLINTEKDDYGYTKWNYWISAVYTDYAIYCDYKTAGIYYKVGYTVSSDNVVSLTGTPEKVEISYTILNNEGGKSKMAEVDVNKILDDNKALLLENENLKKDVEAIKAEKETLVSEKTTLTSEKADIETKLNEANETVVSLGKEKDTLTAQVEKFTAEETERVEKETVAQIETLVNDVKNDLSEDEIKSINEVVETKDVSKVKSFINEVLASKYKAEVKLTNSTNDNFFVVAPTKSVGDSDDLSKFNM